MPYIKEKNREKFKDILEEVSKTVPEATSGELNYLITSIIHKFLMCPDVNQRGYQRFNDVIGVLEGAKLELYHRDITEYENKKMEENGDIEDRCLF